MSTVSSPRAEVEGLLGLINSATHDALSVYEKSGHSIPSVHSPAPHPLDNVATTLALKKAIKVLEGACEQLCATLAPAGHTLMNRAQAFYNPTSMRVAVEAHIPDTLAGHPEGLSITELAEKIGIHSVKLRKIMRALATRHCFRQVGADSFANNRLSSMMGDTNISNVVILITTSMQEGSFSLPDALQDAQYGPSFDPTMSAFMYHHKDKNIQGGFFGFFGLYPDKQKMYAAGMLGWTKATDDASLIHEFPWKDILSGTTFCDVGGGIGAVSIRLAKAHLHLKITLQDLPDVIEEATGFWNKECPQAVQEKRIDFVAFNFLNESPVNGQDIYYLRHVLHDWPDADCVTILKNTRQAMNPDSRLFVQEYTLQAPYKDKSDHSNLNIAPEPLLPNYGAGNIRPYNQDVGLLCIANAGERTLEEFRALGSQAGLAFVKLWEFAEDDVMEFRPV